MTVSWWFFQSRILHTAHLIMFLGIGLSTMAPAPLTATDIYFHCSYSRSFNNTQKFIILTVHSRKPWWDIIGSMAVFWWICLGPGADDRVTNTLFQILFGFTGRMIRSVISVPEQTFGFREERSEPIMLVSIPEVLGTGHRLSWPVSCLYSFYCGCLGLEGPIPSFCSAAERRWPRLDVKPSML